MLASRPFLTVALACLSWTQAAIPATPGTPVTALGPATVARLGAQLPGLAQTAKVVKMGSRIAIVDLQERVVNIGGSREALRTVMASAAKGEAPTYDARLGISREEFSRYLAFQPVLVGTGKTMKLSLVRDSGRLTFNDVPSNSVFRGLSFDLKTGDLRVPEGFNFKAVQLVPSAGADRSIDIRGGFVWNLRGFSAETQSGIHGQVSLYQLGDGQLLLGYHRLSSLIHGTFNNTDTELILKYSR